MSHLGGRDHATRHGREGDGRGRAEWRIGREVDDVEVVAPVHVIKSNMEGKAAWRHLVEESNDGPSEFYYIRTSLHL